MKDCPGGARQPKLDVGYKLCIKLMHSLPKLSIKSQKCDNGDDNDGGDVIHMCRRCVAGDTKRVKYAVSYESVKKR